MDTEHFDLIESTFARSCLNNEAFSQYQKGDISRNHLEPILKSVKALSTAYLEDNPILPVARFSSSTIAAYSLYYMPVNLIKLAFLMHRLPGFLQKKKIRLLDFGSGPGTALAALLSQSCAEIEYVALERSQEMQKFASSACREIARDLGHSISYQSVFSIGDVTDEFDLVVAANSLCELNDESRESMIENLIERVQIGGALMILEPGTQSHTRRLMKSRDKLLSQDSRLKMVFPCTHNALCPMLQSSSLDWCHGVLDGQTSGLSRFRLVKQIDTLAGFNKHRIKYSSLIVGKNLPTPHGVRVVLAPQKSNRGVEAVVCDEEGLRKLLLPKSGRSDETRPFLNLQHYDRAEILNPEPGFRLGKGSKVIPLVR